MPRWGDFSLMPHSKSLFFRVKNYLTKKILEEPMDETRIKIDVDATKKTMGVIVYVVGVLVFVVGCGAGYVIFKLFGWW